MNDTIIAKIAAIATIIAIFFNNNREKEKHNRRVCVQRKFLYTNYKRLLYKSVRENMQFKNRYRILSLSMSSSYMSAHSSRLINKCARVVIHATIISFNTCHEKSWKIRVFLYRTVKTLINSSTD